MTPSSTFSYLSVIFCVSVSGCVRPCLTPSPSRPRPRPPSPVSLSVSLFVSLSVSFSVSVCLFFVSVCEQDLEAALTRLCKEGLVVSTHATHASSSAAATETALSETTSLTHHPIARRFPLFFVCFSPCLRLFFSVFVCLCVSLRVLLCEI
jgi:hypothetical protein